MEYKTLDESKLEIILDCCENIRDKLLMLLMCESRCRVSECLHLEHENVKVDEGTIRIEIFKTSKQGDIRKYISINMTERLNNLYEDYLNKLESDKIYCPYVFYVTTKQNTSMRMHSHNVERLFKRIGEKTGIILRPRDIRHVRLGDIGKAVCKK